MGFRYQMNPEGMKFFYQEYKQILNPEGVTLFTGNLIAGFVYL